MTTKTCKKYRKKPLVIEAFQLGIDLNPDWVFKDWRFQDMIIFNTLEGLMIAKKGDYIIKGIAGEIYSCKPEIFESSYEEVTHDNKNL